MSVPARATRREVMTTVAGGAVLGALWGAAFPVLATEGRPTISVVGEANAQLVLIDSGPARLLLLVGEPSDSLIKRLPAMLTVFRQRIDVLMGTSSALIARTRTLSARWRVRHAVILSTAGEAPSLSVPSTVVTDAIDVSLGGELDLAVRVGHRGEWLATDPTGLSPLWSVRASRGSSVVAIVPDAGSFEAAPPGPSAVLISPAAPPAQIRPVSPANAIAINHDSESIDPPPQDIAALTRIFPQDVARFVLSEDGVELPSWTLPGPGS